MSKCLRFSLPRKLRLSKSSQYQAVYKEKKKWVSKYLFISLKNNNLSHSCLGISITKRIIRDAVDRNKIKRIIKEHFRFRQEKLAGFDLVVSARKEIISIESGEIFKQLGQQWDYFLKALNSF